MRSHNKYIVGGLLDYGNTNAEHGEPVPYSEDKCRSAGLDKRRHCLAGCSGLMTNLLA